MDIRFGSQTFHKVKIPLLWGTRAVIGHHAGELSIIDLSGEIATPEVVMSKPWTNIEFSEREDGVVIYRDGDAVYFFSPARHIIRDITGRLPECEISTDKIRVGTNTISNSMISGSQVGVGVHESGFFIGGPAPSGLASLIV